MGRLDGKVCIMTGADGGICHKASEVFCAEGAKVVMVDINADVEKKCADIVAAGGDAIAIVADVSKKATWEMLLAKTLEKYGTVNVVVNGAAQFSSGDWSGDQSEEEWDRVFDANIRGMRYSYEIVLKYMLDNKIKGSYINFSSSTAIRYMGSGIQAYSLSKAAIKISTSSMVPIGAPAEVRFNCLAPNLIWTPKQANIFKMYEDHFNSIAPLGHIGYPVDCAPLMVFLASDESSYINGTCIPVDGGWHGV